MKKLTSELIQEFKEHLMFEEKSSLTVEKYIRDVTAFKNWCGEQEIKKELLFKYKGKLIEEYAPRSVNSIISSLNAFFDFKNWCDLKLRLIKIQRQIFLNKEKELTKEEYNKLIYAANRKKNQRLNLIIQTICSTGIRVSELRFITVEALKKGRAIINCKGKMRVVFIPDELCNILKRYIREKNISKGAVFVSKNNNPLDRSNIWSEMKKLCESAGVKKEKVFPHNLRHLFARTFYKVKKDVVRLADILGHSNIETTRIYTMETGEEHKRQIEMLGLVMCLT